jgi:hypothetical protein
MTGPVIYHGTPLTPRAALEAVMPGRAACVSFYSPQDAEALGAVCPQLMFRPRRLFVLDGGNARREGMGSGEPGRVVASLLCVARTAPVLAGSMGDYAGQPWGTIAGERRPLERLALWSRAGRSGLAHGWADRAAGMAVRTVRSRLPRLDRMPQEGAGRVRRLSAEDGRGCHVDGQSLASAAHAARGGRCVRLPIHQRRQHEPCAERLAIRCANVGGVR